MSDLPDPFERDESERARARREQLRRARVDRARRRAPARFGVLLLVALVVTAAIRILANRFGWSQTTADVVVSGWVLTVCVGGLPVALAGGASATSSTALSDRLRRVVRGVSEWWRRETEPEGGYGEPA